MFAVLVSPAVIVPVTVSAPALTEAVVSADMLIEPVKPTVTLLLVTVATNPLPPSNVSVSVNRLT